MMTIISDNKNETVGARLARVFESLNVKFTLVPVSDLSIEPCFSCGGCENKTFGKCVVKDDIGIVLSELATSDIWIYTTPVVWGNPSYQIKKVLDKSALLGNRFYKVRHGELVKGVSVQAKKIVFLGVIEDTTSKSAYDFVFYGKEVGNIIDLKTISLVIDTNPTDDQIKQLANKITE